MFESSISDRNKHSTRALLSFTVQEPKDPPLNGPLSAHVTFLVSSIKGFSSDAWKASSFLLESEVCGDVAVVRVSFGPEVLEETTLKESLWLLQSSIISQTMSPCAFFFSLLFLLFCHPSLHNWLFYRKVFPVKKDFFLPTVTMCWSYGEGLIFTGYCGVFRV